MSDLKPQLYWVVYQKEQRTMLITTFVLVLLLFNISYLIPKLIEQKKEFYRLDITEKLFDNPQYRYKDFLNWTLNIDEIIQKKQIIEANSLHTKNPDNYKYIESYISNRLAEIWLPQFRFNSIYNFRNSWTNSIILDITLADKEKLNSFISKVSENWFLWRNISIEKDWWIYKWKVELVFDIK
jgi:hypothetical protein